VFSWTFCLVHESDLRDGRGSDLRACSTLTDRRMSKIKFDLPPWLGRFTESGVRCLVLRPVYGSGILALRNLDNPSKYQSAKFTTTPVDELAGSSLSIFNNVRFRLRRAGIDRPKFENGTNSGGLGHG
jgi:hypothetical protein